MKRIQGCHLFTMVKSEYNQSSKYTAVSFSDSFGKLSLVYLFYGITLKCLFVEGFFCNKVQLKDSRKSAGASSN